MIAGHSGPGRLVCTGNLQTPVNAQVSQSAATRDPSRGKDIRANVLQERAHRASMFTERQKAPRQRRLVTVDTPKAAYTARADLSHMHVVRAGNRPDAPCLIRRTSCKVAGYTCPL